MPASFEMTDTRTLYAVHGKNDLDYDGWDVLTFGIGHDPTHHGGEDMRGRHTVIARLNNGYRPNGTIPEPLHYENFAQRCANFVQASQGCTRWIIGNEMNVEVERPHDAPITPTLYALCFDLCRGAIKALPDHADDQVLVGAVGPWNNRTQYPGNENGDWIQYFEDIQRAIAGCDGFAIHAYAREQTVESVKSNDKMGGEFSDYHNGFRTYTDWMAAIPPRFRGLPVYCTETNANAPWIDADTGFVQAAYQEIFTWNGLHPEQPISCLALYRWAYDQWEFWNKPNVHQDFYNAVECGYELPPVTDPPVEPPQEATLKNPSVELPYYRDEQNSTVEVAHDWLYFASDGKPPERDGPCQLPEYKSLSTNQDARRVWDGHTAQCWFIRWKIFDAGIYQAIDVSKGEVYEFDAMCQAWCSQSDDPTVSDGDMHVMLGIDPTGGTDAFAATVIWSQWERVGADYQKYYSPEVEAQGRRITVFVRAWNKWELSHNDMYVDDMHLAQVSEPPTLPPGGGEPVDYERIRQIVREELDKTHLLGQ